MGDRWTWRIEVKQGDQWVKQGDDFDLGRSYNTIDVLCRHYSFFLCESIVPRDREYFPDNFSIPGWFATYAEYTDYEYWDMLYLDKRLGGRTTPREVFSMKVHETFCKMRDMANEKGLKPDEIRLAWWCDY